MHQSAKDEKCWEVEGTLCNHIGIEIMRGKIKGTKEDACIRADCIYYKYAKR